MNFNFVNCLHLFSYDYLIKTTQLQFDWYYLECAIKKCDFWQKKKKKNGVIGFCKWTLHILNIYSIYIKKDKYLFSNNHIKWKDLHIVLLSYYLI